MLRNERAFTLIEMLIVLLIISALIILIVPNLNKSSKGIDEKSCEALVTVVQTQVNLFHLEKGRYPADIDEMVDGGYLTKQQKACSDDTVFSISGEGIVAKD